MTYDTDKALVYKSIIDKHNNRLEHRLVNVLILEYFSPLKGWEFEVLIYGVPFFKTNNLFKAVSKSYFYANAQH